MCVCSGSVCVCLAVCVCECLFMGIQLLTDSGHWMPSALSVRNGKSFESTLLGKLLSPSTVALSFITPAVSVLTLLRWTLTGAGNTHTTCVASFMEIVCFYGFEWQLLPLRDNFSCEGN